MLNHLQRNKTSYKLCTRGHLIHWVMLSFTREQRFLYEETVKLFFLLSKPGKKRDFTEYCKVDVNVIENCQSLFPATLSQKNRCK